MTGTSSIVLEDVVTRLLQGGSTSTTSQLLKINTLSYNDDTRTLNVKFEYFAEFDITKKKIRFQPSLSTSSNHIKYFFNSPEAIVNL